MLGELADLESLRGKPKHYALSSSGKGTWYPPFELPEQIPAIVEPQHRRAFRLPMCAEPRDRNLAMIVQVIVEHAGGDLPDLGVSVNGCWPSYKALATEEFVFPVGIFTHVPAGHIGLNFQFDAKDIREGWNEFTIYNNARFYELITTGERPSPADRQELSVRIISLEIGVMPRKS